MPDVSVVIPSYNHGRFIEEAVHSVLNQSYGNVELIVIDDGSNDDTLERLGDITDPRLQVVAQENRGAHAAINRGLAMARGKYLAILNSDDVYHLNRLEKLIPILESEEKIGLISSYIEVIDSDGRSLGIKQGYANLEPWLLPHPERSFRAGTDLRAALLTENYLATTSNFLMKRRWYEAVGEFTPLRYTHDWDYALRMAQLAKIELAPEPLLKYRIHGANTIHENRAAMVFEICWCLAVHLPKHVCDPAWYGAEEDQKRSSQFLNSIYTYQQDKVLAVMLLEGLHADPLRALSLLSPENPHRQVFLSYILEHTPKEPVPEQRWLRRIAEKVRSIATALHLK